MRRKPARNGHIRSLSTPRAWDNRGAPEGAALIEGRRFIGSEMTEHYAEVAANRLRTVERGYHDDGQQDALEFDGGAA